MSFRLLVPHNLIHALLPGSGFSAKSLGDEQFQQHPEALEKRWRKLFNKTISLSLLSCQAFRQGVLGANGASALRHPKPEYF